MKLYGAFADVAALDERVAKKLIARKEHPTLPGVALYNYTQHAQFDKAWDEHTIQARGLVVDAKGRILARPFPKFFNHDDPIVVPDWSLPFTVHTKYDGSLFIVADEGRITATRGSFTSPQADWGRELLANMDFMPQEDMTYLFELIHPENRIVVDYGKDHRLVLLAVIETSTGSEISFSGWNIENAQAVSIRATSPNEIKQFERSNEEGFVIHFSNGMRTKIKFDEYKRLHKIVTGCSTKTIWETLRDKKSIDSLIENVPDEFYDFVREESSELTSQYKAIHEYAESIIEIVKTVDTRKDKAVRITRLCEGQHPAVKPACFALLDQKSDWDIVWRAIEPAWKQPFANRGEA